MKQFKNACLLTLSIFLNSCGANLANVGTGIVNGYPFPIDEELMPIINEFEELVGRKITTSVVFSDDFVGENEAGFCLNTQLGIKGIRIKNKYKQVDYEKLKFIVFHELGHCELNRGHDFDLVLLKNNIIKDSKNIEIARYYKPKSVMWPTASFISYYKQKQDSYSSELVNRKFVDENLLEVKSFKNEKEASKNLIVLGLINDEDQSDSEIINYNCDRYSH